MKGFTFWQRCCSLLATSRKTFNNLSVRVRLIIAIALLNLADFYTTLFIVGVEGALAEANPIMLRVIELFGIYGILWWKCIGVGVLFFGHFFLKSHHRLLPPNVFEGILVLTCTIYTTLIAYNLFRVFQIAMKYGMV